MIVRSLDPLLVDDGEVWVADGRIAEAGEGTRLDVADGLVLPGNVCAHTHLYSALARGMPYALEPPRDFLQILQRVWWRLDRALDEESIRASALVGGMEALLCGTTTLIDHHASPNAIDGSLDVIADELESLGIRSVLCYETSDRDGGAVALRGLGENRRFRATRRPLARGLIGAHASFTLSDETLLACAEAGPLHIHAAEGDVDRGAVERLAQLGVLDERTVLAHGIHVEDEELEAFRASRATLAHNARSNMNNAVGRARVQELGPRVALGTDGIGSDMFEESRTAWFRLHEDDLLAPGDWPLVTMAEGAHLAGRIFSEPRLGTLIPTAPADLVVLDYVPPTPLDETNLAGHWIFGLSSRCVRDVMVAGEWVVRNRRLARVDQDALAADASQSAARLWGRLAETPEHIFEPQGAFS